MKRQQIPLRYFVETQHHQFIVDNEVIQALNVTTGVLQDLLSPTEEWVNHEKYKD